MASWRGIFVIIVTPFTKKGELDEDSLRREVRFNVQAGAHGLVGPANASEFSTLSDDERKRWIEIDHGVDRARGAPARQPARRPRTGRRHLSADAAGECGCALRRAGSLLYLLVGWARKSIVLTKNQSSVYLTESMGRRCADPDP